MTVPPQKVHTPAAKPEPIGEGLGGHLSAVAAQVRDTDPAPPLAHPTSVGTLVADPGLGTLVAGPGLGALTAGPGLEAVSGALELSPSLEAPDWRPSVEAACHSSSL